MAGLIHLEIINWDEYQIRRDTKQNSWFRMNHDIFESDQFWDFNREELCFFFYLLCIASKQNSGRIDLSIDRAVVVGRFKKTAIESAIEKLQTLHIVHVDVTSTLRGRDVDVTLHNTTLQTNKTVQSNFDFDICYKNYPRKIGRKKGLEICMSQIKTQEDFDKLLSAIKKYSDHCRLERTEPRYIKHFSTFMGSWTDWILPNAGKVEIVKNTNQVIVEKIEEPVQYADPGVVKDALETFRNRFKNNSINEVLKETK